MNKINLAILFVFFLFTGSLSLAQPTGKEPDEMGPPNKRLEQFRKMRMVEVLNLKEEESVRFFAKQNEHEDRVKELMKERNETLDDIQDALDQKTHKDLQKLTDKIEELDRKLFDERLRFQQDIQKLLTPEQYAKFFVFEREFGKKMRGAMDDFIQHRRDRWRDGNE